jgi:hypothetical protein
MTQPVDRLSASLQAILSALLPSLYCYVQWEMRVIASTPPAPPALGPGGTFTTPATVTCTPVDPKVVTLLPTSVQIPVWPGPSGAICLPLPGSLVRVGFVNADPSKPVIMGVDPQVMPVQGVVGALKTFSVAAAGVPGMAAACTALQTQLSLLG